MSPLLKLLTLYWYTSLPILVLLCHVAPICFTIRVDGETPWNLVCLLARYIPDLTVSIMTIVTYCLNLSGGFNSDPDCFNRGS